MLRTERTFKAIWNALFIIWRLSLKQIKQIFLKGEIPTLILFFNALKTGVEELSIQSFLVNWDWNQWIKYNFEGKWKTQRKIEKFPMLFWSVIFTEMGWFQRFIGKCYIFVAPENIIRKPYDFLMFSGI